MSTFENEAKLVFEMMRDGELNGSGASLLLDWLDKVRVGLWRYELSINENSHSIEPKFAINQRIGGHDRFAIIQRLKNEQAKGIHLSGLNKRVFLNLPSVFGIVFRDLALISYSGSFAAYDYFGMTVPADSASLSEGEISRHFRGFTNLNRSARELSFLGGSVIFEFKNFFPRQPVGSLNSKTWYSESDGIGQFQEMEPIKLTRTDYSSETFFPLFELNVAELQKASMYVFDGMVDPRVLQLRAKAERQLDREAETWLSALNDLSLFRRMRTPIKIPYGK